MVRETKDFVMIDLTGIVKLLVKRFWIVVLCAVIGAGAAGWYSTTIQVTPMYRATAKLYVTGTYAASVSSSTISGGQAVLASYYSILESRPVIEEVIEKCGLNISVSGLKSCISQSSISGTSMINLSVSFIDPQWAKLLVDELITVSAKQAYEIMGMTPPVIYEEATIPTAPYNTEVNTKKYVILGAAAGAGAAILALIIWFLADNRIYTPQQLNWRTGLNTKGITPKKKGKKYNTYSRKSMQHLYAEICAQDEEVTAIAVTGRKNEKNDVIEALKDFLVAIDKKVVVLNTDMTVPHESTANVTADQNEAGSSASDTAESKAETATGTDKAASDSRLYLEDYLAGKTSSIEEIVAESDGYDRIEACKEVLNSYELLKGSNFDKLMEALKDKYDFVLVDTAPLDNAIDAQAVFKDADMKLLAIGCGKTAIGKAESAIKLLGGNDALDGAVFTGVKIKQSSKDFRESFGAYINLN